MMGVPIRRGRGLSRPSRTAFALAVVLLSAVVVHAADTRDAEADRHVGFEVWVKRVDGGGWDPAERSGAAYLIPTHRAIHFRAQIDRDRRYSWDLGDPHNRTGMAAFKANPVHVYTVEGRYTVTFRAHDGSGEGASASATLLASNLDTTPPGAPADLSATALSPSQIDLRWSAASDDVGVERYRIRRDGRVVGEAIDRHYADIGLVPGSTHHYAVTGLDANDNESTPTEPLVATSLPAGQFAPGLRGRAITATHVILQWSPLADSFAAGGYAVLRDGQEIGRSRAAFFSDASLASSTEHRYALRAIDDQGGLSESSGGVSVTTLQPGQMVPFTLAILPDTQIYSQFHPEIFQAQTRWIRDNRLERNIVFALHEGDITNTNAEPEWTAAVAAMSLLDGIVPYALATGNHDQPASRPAARDMARFNDSFPAATLRRRSDFGGAFESQRMDNVFHLFAIGPVQFMILVLEYEPRDPVLEWANEIVARHPERNVILLTHAYLDHDGTRLGSGEGRTRETSTPSDEEADVVFIEGEAIWQKLVRRHPNFLLVLSGHVLGSGTARLESRGDAGNSVYQVLANYQHRPRGGSGFLRLLELDPGQATIDVTTYSPVLDLEKQDGANRFTIEGVRLILDTDTPW